MRSKLIYGTVVTAALSVLLYYTAPVLAHHAFGAEFDREAPLTIRGEVTQVEWVNPHSWIHIEVDEFESADGMVDQEKGEVWMVEGGTPNTLLRRGLRRDCLTPGTEIVVDGYRSKNPNLRRANGRDITFADGTKIFMGSSGTGAPDDGSEREQLQRGRQRC